MVHGARIRGLSCIGVLAMAVAACSSSSSSSSTTATTAAGSATTAVASGTGGCAPGSGAAVSGGSINIGFFGALTGANAQLGINIRNGVKLAVDQYNAKGGSPKVVLKEYDSAGDPTQAPQLARTAISDHVAAIIGPAFSGESKVADPILEQGNIVSISPSATDDSLSNNGWKCWHRIIGKNAAQGAAAEQYISQKIKAKTIAVIDDNSQYGKGIADVVRGDVGADSITVGDSESIDPNSQDYSSTVNKVVAAKVDAVFYGGYYAEAGRLLKQLRDAGYKNPFVSDDGAADQKLVDAAGTSAAEGALTTLASGDITKIPAAAKFVTDYTAAYKTGPATYSGEGFDATNDVLAAIAAGKTTAGDINAYIDSNSYTGVTKTISFDTHGDIQGGGVFMYGIVGGKLTYLGLIADLVKS
jgi:branched-chain amino acid transport system substrate-binding protein